MVLEQHLATDVFQDQQVHFQIVVLDRQLFIWIGTDPARLSNLCMATPTRMDPIPAATSLLGRDADDVTSMSQRLAKRVGKPVALSVNLPSNQPEIRAFAERRLMQELRQLELVQQAAGLSVVDPGGRLAAQ